MFRFLKNLLSTDRDGIPSAQSPVRLGLEPLEDRRLLSATPDPFGNLRIEGTSGNDVCKVYQRLDLPIHLYVELNGTTRGYLGVRRVQFFGGEGDDVFDNDVNIEVVAYGGGGHDILFGGPGLNWLYGETGNDYLNYCDFNPPPELAVPYLNPLRHQFSQLDHFPSRDPWAGSWSWAPAEWGLTVADGGSGYDVIQGGDGADSLSGGTERDILLGGVGRDILMGEAGDDDLYGEHGRDSLFGGVGLDRLYGGWGDDYLDGGRDSVSDMLVDSLLCMPFGLSEDDRTNNDTYVRYQKSGWTSEHQDVFIGYDYGSDLIFTINLDDREGFGGGGIWAG